MKKLLFTILAVLAMGGAMAQSPAFPDIPAGHWAGEAVERIANLGIIIGFPDGTFRGNENITRYQAALVISRTLDVIQRDIGAVKALHETDVVSLRNAIQELASDIAANNVRLTGVENSVVAIIARLDDMEAEMMGMGPMGPTMAQINALIASLRTELVALINANANRIGVLDSAVASLSADVNAVSDDVVSNAARIAAIEAAMAEMESMMMGMEGPDMGPMMGQMSALQDEVANLRNRIAAVEIQADSASAAAAAAAATANGAAAGVEALRAQIRQNGRSIDAIEALIALLNDDVLGLQDNVGSLRAEMMGMDSGGGMMGSDPQTARNTSDISNIRDFVILLRRNQVDLQNRVGDLEASGTASAEAIADLSARLDAVEGDLLKLEGEISLDYTVVRVNPGFVPFDVDRVFGEDLPRGRLSGFNDDNDEDDDFSSTPDFFGNEDGDVDVGFEATFTFADTKNALGSPNALNGFSGVVDLSLERDFSAIDDDNDLFRGYVITLDDITTTFSPIGMDPITFQFGEEIDVDFTPYVVYGGYDGFVANFGTPDFLAAFDPTLQFFYGSPGTDKYVYGVRGTLSPIDGFFGGVSYATGADNAREYGDIGDGTISDPNGDNDTHTVFGVDGSVSVSIIDLEFEFASETLAGAAAVDTASIVVTPTSDESNSNLYVTVGVDGESLPILNSLSGNFRMMDDVWNGLEYFADGAGVVDGDDLDDAEDDYPFDLDQTGFRVDAGLGLFILDVNAFFDSYQTNVADDDDANDDSTTAFGVDASADLFAGFALTAFFEQVSVSIDGGDTNVVDTNDGTTVLDNGDSVTANTERNDQYDTGFGIGLEHDGGASNALISGLDIDFEFSLTEADFSVTTITADLDYDLSISILNLTPYFGFESVTDSDDIAGEDDYTAITAGTGFETDALGIIFEPSLHGNVNFRTGSHAIQGGNEYDTSVLQFNVGFTLGAFLLDHSTLTFDYGSFTGTNVGATVSDDADTGDTATSTSGIEVVWDYYDLEFAYGDFTSDPNTDSASTNDESKVQTFGISYTVTF